MLNIHGEQIDQSISLFLMKLKCSGFMKQVLPYEGLSIARMLRRDGIEKIAQLIGGEKG